MELICYEIERGRVALRPAPKRRDWMDESPGQFAYRCLPLTMANAHGWEMLCPVSFEAVWNGGRELSDIEITFDKTSTRAAAPEKANSELDLFPAVVTAQPLGEQEQSGIPRHFVESHFGNGVLTFNPLVILRTASGYNLWITGPSNEFKDGIAAMSALVETDWMPFTFSMNWKFTRPGHKVRFDQGDPICFFFPVPRDVVGQCEPSLNSISDDPALARSYMATRYQRNLAAISGTDDDARFQGWYLKGRDPGNGRGPTKGHQTSIGAKPFAR